MQVSSYFQVIWEQKIEIIVKAESTAKGYTIITPHHPIPANLLLTFYQQCKTEPKRNMGWGVGWGGCFLREQKRE